MTVNLSFSSLPISSFSVLLGRDEIFRSIAFTLNLKPAFLVWLDGWLICLRHSLSLITYNFMKTWGELDHLSFRDHSCCSMRITNISLLLVLMCVLMLWVVLWKTHQWYTPNLMYLCELDGFLYSSLIISRMRNEVPVHAGQGSVRAKISVLASVELNCDQLLGVFQTQRITYLQSESDHSVILGNLR